MLQAFRELNFVDQQLSRLEDNVAEVFTRLTAIALLDGIRVAATLASGANTITHKLGRIPQGWIVTDLSASAAVTLYRNAAFTATTFPLTASAACSVVLWVF